MCTVSWLHDGDGYELLCNRDEKLSRAPALPPQIRERHGVRYVAPMDGNFGGAWIGTNEFGVSICLLNGAGGAAGRRSRGLLIPELLTGSSNMEVAGRISESDLSPYAAFTLAILEPGQYTMVVEWDGQEKAIVPYGEPYMPLVSSSFDPQGVQTRRREEFTRRLDTAGKLDSSVLFAFHESHGRRADAYSPCMHRPDARTVSFSWVRVTDSTVKFFYTPEAPCQWTPGQSVALELAR
jgi:hypothetical protein